MHCNGCQAATPEGATDAELVDEGWRVDELARTTSSPASKLYYCPTCAVALDHATADDDAAPPTPREGTKPPDEIESVIEGPSFKQEATTSHGKKRSKR